MTSVKSSPESSVYPFSELQRQHPLKRDALAILKAALHAADAGQAVKRHLTIKRGALIAPGIKLPLNDFDRIFVLAIGKAALAMAAPICELLGPRLTGGIAVTKHGHGYRSRTLPIEVHYTGHPVPDQAGFEASAAVRDLLRELNARDLLLVAISGGASALLPAPADSITLEDKQQTTDLLLRAGADIYELNTVRKHLSYLKGGQLAALAYPATVVALLLSDVIGDPIDVIGSGPTVPDPSTFDDAHAVLTHFGVHRVPRSVRDRIQSGVRGDVPETPKPGDSIFANVHNVVIGSNRLALQAAAAYATSIGYRPLILSTTIQGETRHIARAHAEILREVLTSGNPVAPPVCLLSGGETTVTVNGAGKGGRNQEFVLSAAVALAGLDNLLVLSAGTDGTDGPTDAAGAIATGQTVARASCLHLSAQDHLDRNDSYPFFDVLGDLIKTGPTGTNVMDIHMLLAGDSPRS